MATVDGVIDGVNFGSGTNYVYPAYNGGGFGGFGNGMDGLWGLIALAIVFGGFGGNGFGWGGNGNNGAASNMMYDINANTNRGFDQLTLTSGIDGLQNAITTGFANAEVGRCNQTTNLLQSINNLASQQAECLIQ